MHKKLADDLTSLAHSILRMKDKNDVFALKSKAHEVYEKLALLTYVEEYINTTPNAEYTKNELIAKISNADIQEKPKEPILEIVSSEEVSEVAVLNAFECNEEEVVESIEIVEEHVVVSKAIEEIEEEPTEVNDILAETSNITPDVVIEEVEVDEDIAEKGVMEMSSFVTQQSVAAEIEEQPFDELQELLFGGKEEVLEEDKQELNEEVEVDEVEQQLILENELSDVIPDDDVEEGVKGLNEEFKVDEVEQQLTLENELSDKIPADVITEDEKEIVEQDAKVDKVKQSPTLEDELGDTISVDVMANIFEKVAPKRTLHDKLQNTIRIDLNDRIAFVKNLFNGNQEDFNRVLSQLNTLSTESAAKRFIEKMVKPDYDWSDKEEYETRLIEIIERKFIV